MIEYVLQILLGTAIIGLGSACCGEDTESQQLCTPEILPYSRPQTTKDYCFFDPFEKNPQTTTYTWDQSRAICRSLNATLPIIYSWYGTHMLRATFILFGRYWIGLRRSGTGSNHTYVDVPLSHDRATNFTNWAKFEPNNAGCAEDCAHMNYDGTWNDYACNFTPPWDKCDDIIHTVCHDTTKPECILNEKPVPIPVAEDWYIILAVTFGGIIGVVTLIAGVRFVVDQCTELRKK